MILAFFGISRNWFLIGKVIDQVYGSRDHDWLSVHGTMRVLWGSEGHRDSLEREREEVIRVLTNSATWRRSCEDSHTTALNKGGRWFSDGEMVPGMRRRD
jgi:hypothetical protein